MEIKNGILISVEAADFIDGKFENEAVIDVVDCCFREIQEAREIILKNAVNVGCSCFYNLPNLTDLTIGKNILKTKTIDDDVFILETTKTTADGITIDSCYSVGLVIGGEIVKYSAYFAFKDGIYGTGWYSESDAIENLKRKIAQINTK